MPRRITVMLEDDAAAFLELVQAGLAGNQADADFSGLINSLIRQERFRQGYGAFAGMNLSGKPARNAEIESAMLQRSGLLPWQPRRRGWSL